MRLCQVGCVWSDWLHQKACAIHADSWVGATKEWPSFGAFEWEAEGKLISSPICSPKLWSPPFYSAPFFFTLFLSLFFLCPFFLLPMYKQTLAGQNSGKASRLSASVSLFIRSVSYSSWSYVCMLQMPLSRGLNGKFPSQSSLKQLSSGECSLQKTRQLRHEDFLLCMVKKNRFDMAPVFYQQQLE